MVGDDSDESDPGTPNVYPFWFTTRGQILIALAFVSLVILITQIVHPGGFFQIPHIKADPYVRPEGCEKYNYASAGFKPISSKCANARYYLGDGSKWGWVDHSGLYFKFHDWYRVDNDAVAIGCNKSRTDCGVIDVHENIFYQNNSDDLK